MNPAEEKRRERKEEAERRKNRRTLKQLFDTFLESRILKPGTRKQYENLRDSAFGEMADMPVDEISEDIVRKWFLKMREESPAYAAQAARVLGAVFNSQALVNPCKVISRERAWPKQKRRTNFIGESDLPNFFKAIYELRTTSVHKDSKGKDLEPHVFQMLNHRRKVGADLIEFAVFTGLRKSEACGLRWDFIKFEDRILTIPDTKNGKPHTLPLTEHLETILKRRKEYADSVGSKWVFPAVSLGSTGHISEPRGIIDDIEGLGSVAFGMHDLRRTFDTHAMRQGIGYLQLKLLMNHSLTADVTAGYTQLTVDDLRPAMEAITRFFLSMMAKGQTLKLTNQQSA
jgi:integrase